MQHTVDPVTDDDLGLERLDVDIRSRLQNSVLQERINDTNDRKPSGDLFQITINDSSAFLSEVD